MMDPKGGGMGYGFMSNGRGQTPSTTITPTSTPSDENPRWLSLETFEAAKEGFNTYDPEQWLPTLKVQLSDFMFWPWVFISMICFSCTVYAKVIAPQHMEWFDIPLDAHIVHRRMAEDR